MRSNLFLVVFIKFMKLCKNVFFHLHLHLDAVDWLLLSSGGLSRTLLMITTMYQNIQEYEEEKNSLRSITSTLS
jgi:hypothetical protein